MQRVVSADLWPEVARRAKRASSRQVAIAYVTQDFVGLKKGDTLIADASRRAIASGETSAPLLRSLVRRGVDVYHCADLHAKVLLFGNTAVVGSANMSSSSNGLVEAAVLSDESAVVSAVASLIEQLRRRSSRLTPSRLDALCQIEVIRRGRAPVRVARRMPKMTRLGNRTWLVGVRELTRVPNPVEQSAIDTATEKLRGHFDDGEEPDWIRWRGKGLFTRASRNGDSFIQIWRSANAKRPSKVYRTTPVLLKQRRRTWTRFYLRTPEAFMTWGRFQKLLKDVGYARKVAPGSAHLLPPELGTELNRKWASAAR